MKKGLISMLVLLFVGLQSVFAQSHEISGVVTSADDGLTIPGVSVMVKGTTTGVSTDLDGKYTLKVPADAKVLVFSFVGMETQEIAIAGKTTINVVLKSAAKTIGEVVVTGYSVVNKKSYTGAASVVKSESLVKTAGGVTKALQGKVAGVQVMGDDIRIRGYGSLSASSEPLYVVDGVIGAPRPSDEDIEAMTVLKDAAATALYGSQGANGVIVITMKKGKKGKTKFNVKYQHTIDKLLSPEWDRMNASQYYKHQFLGTVNAYPGETEDRIYALFDKAMRNNNPYNMAKPFNIDGTLKDNAKLLYDTNWVDALLKTSVKDEVYFSVAGGNEKSNFHISSKAWDRDGYLDAISSRGLYNDLKFATKLSDKIKFSIRTSLSYWQGSTAYTRGASENNLLYVGYSMSPATPIYEMTKVDNNDGTYGYKENRNRYNWINPNYNDYNPVALLEMDPRKNYGLWVFFAPKLDVEIIKDLKFSTTFVGRYNTSNSSLFQNPFHGSGQTENGLSQKKNDNSRSYFIKNILTYRFDLNEDHHFKALLGNEVYDYINKDFSATKVGYPLGGEISDELSSGQKPRHANSGTVEEGRISYFSNLEYNFLGKYFLSGSFRTDGSSKFGPDNRWGNFWSVGGSWRISEEDFFDMEWVNNLKLRTSYGITGNNSIGDYKYGNYYSMGADYDGQTGLLHTNLPNNLLGWEESTSFSVGLDFDLFNHRLSGTIEGYKRGSDGLLYKVPIPITSGFPSILMNIGEMENTGVELELNGKIIDSNDLKWTSTFTMSTNKNKIVSLPTKQVINGTKRWVKGGSLYDYYLREWAGVDPANGDPLWYKNEEQADGSIKKVTTNSYRDATYYTNLGQSTPKMYLGLSNELSYKGFNLSVDLVGGFGHKVYDGRYAAAMHDGQGKARNLAVDALNAWTPDNTKTNVPKYIYGNTNKSNSASSRWLVNGDYVKIKNVSLSYNLSSQLANKLYLDSARVFFTVDNVYSFSDYKSGDPEISLSGVSSGVSFNNSRVFRIGVDIKF